MYGQSHPDFNYGVVNERAVRAGAGMMFLAGILTFAYTYYTRDYKYVNIIVPIFWFEFFVKVVFGPKYGPIGFIAKLLVRKQQPELIGAIQKRFAWSLGLILATIMLIFAVGMGVRGKLPFIICTTCLTFMWMESALGICVGCKIYNALLKAKILKEPEFKPACPGGACAIKQD